MARPFSVSRRVGGDEGIGATSNGGLRLDSRHESLLGDLDSKRTKKDSRKLGTRYHRHKIVLVDVVEGALKEHFSQLDSSEFWEIDRRSSARCRRVSAGSISVYLKGKNPTASGLTASCSAPLVFRPPRQRARQGRRSWPLPLAQALLRPS